MLTLHHGPGSASSQKVRLALAEKALEWESRTPGRGGMRTPEYLALNPDGVVPTLVHEGRVVRESRLVNEYLEDAFPETARLRPSDPYLRFRQAQWSRHADETLHLNVFVLMFVISRREAFIKAPREQWRANLPGLNDPIKQERTYDVAVNGFESRYVDEAVARFKQLMVEMDDALASGPWLAGEDYTLADVDVAPFVHRLAHLGLSGLWEGRWRRVSDWYARVKARPSFETAVTRWEAEEDRQLMAAGAAKAEPLMRPRLAG